MLGERFKKIVFPDLWITSLLFDFIKNLLMGALLLALAKSIYNNATESNMHNKHVNNL